MHKRLVVFILILFVSGKFTIGQDREIKISIADSILKVRGEVYFSFSKHKFTQAASRFLSIKKVIGDSVFAYANAADFKEFQKLNADFSLQPENFLASRLKSTQRSNPDLVYPSYPAFQAIMEKFAQQFPSFCHVAQIGTSVQGRKILAARISASNPVAGKPVVLLTSSIHGNELAGFKISLRLIDYLLRNYNHDALVKKLMGRADIWIIPLLNPDGTYFGGDNSVAEATRFNANNLDLNRNFPDPADGPHPDNEARQPETLALMEFYEQQGVVLSAALHTGDELINYPWDTWSKPHADANWYRYVSRQYVDSVHQKNRFYMTDFENGIVNGYYWYRITGGQQDYVNYFLHSREITVELSKSDMPDSVTLSKFWDCNREPLLRFLEHSLHGIQGTVTDKTTRNPLRAKIELIHHDRDQSWVYSDKPMGQYYRMLFPGQYRVLVSAPGYIPGESEFTMLQNDQLNLSFELEPASDAFTVYPNPFRNRIYVIVNAAQNPGPEIKVTLSDVTGRVVFNSLISSAVTGPVEIIPLALPPGIYFLSLQNGTVAHRCGLLKI